MNSGTSLPPVQQRSAHVRTRTRSTASSVGADYNIEYGLRNEAGEQQIEEEIAEIKRYEDFTTIDWVQDAVREHARRQLRKQQLSGWRNNNGKVGWKYRLYESYEAGQAWMVVTLIGMAIGMIAAIINIVSEWLSDIKIGHCKTAFYLNEEFCCWGEDNGCDAWENWSGFALMNYLIYTFMAVSFALASASLVQAYAPYAAGSGISEIKCIIAGFVMKGFLGFWTLFIKSVALPITIASGLSVGKEGPSVHYAVCTSNVISRMFGKYKQNASKTREVLCAGAAAGVAVAFGSPIGGVLFSLEEMSTYFPLRTLWRSYFCALVAVATLSAMNPFRTGQLVLFQVQYDRSWHFFEILFYILLGILGGLYGECMIYLNLKYQAFRKKRLSSYPILEAVVLAAITAVLCYPNAFLRIEMAKSMEILFLECEGAEDYHGLCEKEKRFWNITSLLLATTLRFGLVVISYGCKVPAGIFVPSMAIGASFGRAVGIIVQALHESSPESMFFSSCKPEEPCITPGTYALLGAAAALSGIMHLTVSVVVIMFELTGAVDYILPTMIVVGMSKLVTTLLGGKGGIADRVIPFSGFPFLDSKEEHNFGVPVSRVMRTAVVTIPMTGLELKDVEKLLSSDKYQGFPVVESEKNRILYGYIGHTELRYAVDRIRRNRPVAPSTPCNFIPPHAAAQFLREDNPDASPADALIDFGRYVDSAPITANPNLPLETVIDLFCKIGPRVILTEFQGKLVGLVTVKDCLKFQHKVEGTEIGVRDAFEDAQEKLWLLIQRVSGWVADRVFSVSGGRIHLRAMNDHMAFSQRDSMMPSTLQEEGEDEIELSVR
ncbi:putative chloride channel protein UM03490-D [Ceratocystis fimbriata CBS 114723]|uniref:Chloride channel protein n=1 Tax=Ceratocystis fimbriata CBS 114723 TaxID=1035309 RepID=A0A2C5X5A0_9PEZI|nr:putative chloride channel protein UM03490-D [Ceratocystis fimbriata CBS 114723]